MVNQSVNDFKTRFPFKIDALQQDLSFPLDIAATFFKNWFPKLESYWYQKGSRFQQVRQLKTITRETRGSFCSEMWQWKQKIISEQ